MQNGVHIIRRSRLDQLAERGADVPGPWVGVLDLARMVEGHIDEPEPRRPLGIVGLEALLRASDEHADDIMRIIRRQLHAGKHYFEWKKIPLVFLVDGELAGRHDAKGVMLEYGHDVWDLGPMLGKGMKAKIDDEPGWWWAPQVG